MPGVFGYEVHTGNQRRGCLYWKLSLFSKELKRKAEKNDLPAKMGLSSLWLSPVLGSKAQ